MKVTYGKISWGPKSKPAKGVFHDKVREKALIAAVANLDDWKATNVDMPEQASSWTIRRQITEVVIKDLLGVLKTNEEVSVTSVLAGMVNNCLLAYYCSDGVFTGVIMAPDRG